MKTVIILAPDFAPSSYPPALRARFFASHLPEFGWKPIVIATEPRYYETPVDAENNQLLPPDLEVIRTKALLPRWTRRFGLGDLGWRSLWCHWHALKQAIRERQPDLLFLPTPPSPGLLLGRLAHACFGTPYVVDLIDPIATDYYWGLPKTQRPPKWWLAYRIARGIERISLRRASHISAVDTSYAGEALRRYSWLRARNVTGIPYGGEPADFDYVRQHARANPIFNEDDGLLHCCYVGVVGPYMMPTIRALLDALRLGVERRPTLFSRVRMHFVGTSYTPGAEPRVLPVAEAAGVLAHVTEHTARVGYLDAIQLLMSSRVLVALGSEEAHYTASKIFPYLMANRPLLAIFHKESSVISMLRETGAALPVTFASRAELNARSEQIYDRWQRLLLEAPASPLQQRMQRFAPFTTRAMAAKLAAVFDNVAPAPQNDADSQPVEGLAARG